MPPALEPTTISFPEADLEDLRRRLAATRLADPIAGAGWTYGIDIAFLRDLVEYWRAGFDWRTVERELNRYENGYTSIDGHRIHVLRAKSPHPGALPLLLSHGWPGSVLEFMKILGPLADPVAHGGDARDAFEVIAPSLPGYGLSEAPRFAGYGAKKLASMLAALMPALGYARYGAQGGDWGATILPYVAIEDPARCVGLHLNLVLAPKPPDGYGDVNETELAALLKARDYMKTGTAYQKVQGLEPDLIGVALTDSPAALLAWIVSKFRSWSDCDGDVYKRFTRDELLANVTLYWLTRTGASSARLYFESMVAARLGAVGEYVKVPTACALFPRELFRPPRAWADRVFNVERWTEMKAGGHFAAMEEPMALVEDVRAFFRDKR